jgi:hypothetical protein
MHSLQASHASLIAHCPRVLMLAGNNNNCANRNAILWRARA